MKILIIGGGPAAVSAAESARKSAPDAEIRLLCEEPLAPYHRVQLSRAFGDPALGPDTIALHPAAWYEQRNIALSIGEPATELHPYDKLVRTRSAAYPYDRLILATGGRANRVPVAGLTQPIYTLRCWADALSLRPQIASARLVTIIGGGLLGLELAWDIHKAGPGVRVLEIAPWLMPRQLTAQASARVTAYLMDNGIEVRTGVSPEVMADNCAGELILCAAGARPEADLARAAGISCDRGILVDDHMRTSDPDIFAAGDAAQFGVSGLWPIAVAQGQIAGRNAAGEDAVYVPKPPSPLLSIGDLQVVSAGDIAQATGDAPQPRSAVSDTDAGFRQILYKASAGGFRVLGGILIGQTAGLRSLLRCLETESIPGPEETLLSRALGA